MSRKKAIVSKKVATVKEVAETLALSENQVRYGLTLKPLPNTGGSVRYSREYLNEFFQTNIFTI